MPHSIKERDLEKLMVTQLVRQFPDFRKPKGARRWMLLWAR
jgi:hypothetical protein